MKSLIGLVDSSMATDGSGVIVLEKGGSETAGNVDSVMQLVICQVCFMIQFVLNFIQVNQTGTIICNCLQ